MDLLQYLVIIVSLLNQGRKFEAAVVLSLCLCEVVFRDGLLEQPCVALDAMRDVIPKDVFQGKKRRAGRSPLASVPVADEDELEEWLEICALADGALRIFETPLGRSPRRWWKNPCRPGNAFSRMLSWHEEERLNPGILDHMYLTTFRMRYELFEVLVDKLEHSLPPPCDRVYPNLHTPLTAREKLAVTLYWIAKGPHYAEVADQFCLGITTVFKLIRQVVDALIAAMVEDHIRFPSGEAVRSVIAGFHELCGLPQTVGAVDGCLIPIKCPPGAWNFRYHCYKGFDAILLLAVVDSAGMFTYVKSGFPGCIGDAAAWNDCALKDHVERGGYYPADCVKTIDGVRVGPFIVGDSAFPFSHCLMKCYNGDHRPGTPHYAFNYKLIRTRRVVENAFGRLKARFRVLKAGRMSDVALAGKVITLCCALHNFIGKPTTERERQFEEQLFQDVQEDVEDWERREGMFDAPVGRGAQARAAAVIRDTLAASFDL